MSIWAAILGGIGAKAGYDIQKDQLKLQKKEAQDRALDQARQIMRASEEAALRGYSTDVDERLATAGSDLGKLFIGRDRSIQGDAAIRRRDALKERYNDLDFYGRPIIDQYARSAADRYSSSALGPQGAFNQYGGYLGGGINTGGVPSKIANAMHYASGEIGQEMSERADLMGDLASTRKMDERTQTMADTLARADAGETAMRQAGKEDLGIAESMLRDEQTKMNALIDRRKNKLDRKYGTTGAAIRQGVNKSNPWKYASQIVGSMGNLQNSDGSWNWI